MAQRNMLRAMLTTMRSKHSAKFLSVHFLNLYLSGLQLSALSYGCLLIVQLSVGTDKLEVNDRTA